MRLGGLEAPALTASQRGAALAQAMVGSPLRLLAAEPRLNLSTLALSTPYGKVAAQAELRDAPLPEAATDLQGGSAWQVIRCGSLWDGLSVRRSCRVRRRLSSR